jgi:hypothetical protein
MKNVWNERSLKEGFDRFYKENGRLPIAPEIDKLGYLPSSRHIQRKYGGLKNLRKKLGYKDTDFGSGFYRQAISSRVNKDGRDAEFELEKLLIAKFHEVFVHTEKIFDHATKNRVDFFIYSPSGNFGIDIFHTQTFKDLQKNVNIKVDKYKHFQNELYLVVANDNFSQDSINAYITGKRKLLPAEARVLNLKSFLQIIEGKSNYSDPLDV